MGGSLNRRTVVLCVGGGIQWFAPSLQVVVLLDRGRCLGGPKFSAPRRVSPEDLSRVEIKRTARSTGGVAHRGQGGDFCLRKIQKSAGG